MRWKALFPLAVVAAAGLSRGTPIPSAEKRHEQSSVDLQYYGGPVIGNAELVPVFVGKQWNEETELAGMRDEIGKFLSVFAASPTVQGLAEYGTNDTTIGTGSSQAPTTLNLTLGESIDNQEIALNLMQGIVNDQLPSRNDNSFYLMYLPPGVQVSRVWPGAPSELSCKDFAGYHSETDAHDIDSDNPPKEADAVPYAVIPHCSRKAWRDIDSKTYTSSHEILEGITDPNPAFSPGWRTSSGREKNEIADICEKGPGGGTLRFFLTQSESEPGRGDGYKYTLAGYYSNAKGGCTIGVGSVVPVTFESEGGKGLSVGAKAGIGAGAAVVGLIAALGGAYAYGRKHPQHGVNRLLGNRAAVER